MIKKINIIYSSALLFGVLQRILEIIAFIVPIQCIYSITRGQISNRLKIIFNLFSIENINSENQIVFFSIIFLILLIFIFIIVRFKERFINAYKKNIVKDLIKNKKKTSNINLDNVDKFINNYTLIIFCIILLSGLILYDLQIGMIVVYSGIILVLIINNLEKNYKNSISYYLKNNYKKNTNKLKIKETLSQIRTRYLGDLDIVNSAINLMTMLIIMYSIFFREEPEISILYIFVIRLYLSRIKNVIKNIDFNIIKKKLFSLRFFRIMILSKDTILQLISNLKK